MILPEDLLDIESFDEEVTNSISSDKKDVNTFGVTSEIVDIEEPKTKKSSIIKVIGVGGGGGNAVNNMAEENIKDVDLIVCNTDKQALELSRAPVKIQLGEELTEGLGAGNDPEKGKKAARESLSKIEAILDENTKMVFITAGMGGGTGTGAAPEIAKVAKGKGILTVAVVTLPFRFEGEQRLKQAVEGIKRLKENVDALIIIDNEKITKLYGKLKVEESFKRADQVLTIAVKGIADIINSKGKINVDFADVKRVLENSGIAIMGTGVGKGENKVLDAIKQAVESPLIDFIDLSGANKLLVNISINKNSDTSFSELVGVINSIQKRMKSTPNTIWGFNYNDSLDVDAIGVTIIATGFKDTIDTYLEKVLNESQKNRAEREEPEIQQPHNSYEALLKQIIKMDFKQSIIRISKREDIERYYNEPAYIRAGLQVEVKDQGIDKYKLITIN